MPSPAVKPNNRRIRVLGIDPAAAGATGYAVIETDGRECRALRFGAMRPRRDASPAWKLREIHRLVAGLVAEFAPGAVALESAFSALNVGTAMRLAEVRGVVLLAAAESDIPVHSYAPRRVKALIAGYGQASKEQMQEMVRSQLCLEERPQPADAADAIAVALCHIHATRAQARLEQATGSLAGGGRGAGASSRANGPGSGARARRGRRILER